jgi:hypothetical protein
MIRINDLMLGSKSSKINECGLRQIKLFQVKAAMIAGDEQ